MPWKEKIHDRNEIIKELIGEVALKRDVDTLFKSILIRTELLRHDFTKRQLRIILFIFALSFPYGKDKALIPKLKDFEMCGISITKCRHELNQLVKMNVIEWEQEENLFSFRSTKYWDVPYNDGYSDSRSQELLLLNLKHAGIDSSGLLERFKKSE